jgi:hypothetical protein
MDDETDIWLEALSGRVTEDRRAAAREAQALRAALQRWPAAQEVPVLQRDAQREAALLERARREGLIRARHNRVRASVRSLVSWPALAALAAVCAAVAAFVILSPAGTPRQAARTEVTRGHAIEGPVRLRAADPQALKRTLLEELRAAGVQATGYERLGVPGIDADLPMPVPDRVRAVLDRHRIPIPPDGVLRIEIVPAMP